MTENKDQPMIKSQAKFINTSGMMVVDDPSVDKSEALIVNVLKGVWYGELTYDKDLNLLYITACHEDACILLSGSAEIEIPVISSQIGIFDHADYRNDEAAKSMPVENYELHRDGDLWYCAMSKITNSSKSGGAVYDYGILSEVENGDYILSMRKSIDNEIVDLTITI